MIVLVINLHDISNAGSNVAEVHPQKGSNPKSLETEVIS